MNNLHYFNPGHETAVFQGGKNFTPSGNVRKMMSDLACLPAWYANPGDFIFTENVPSTKDSYLPEQIQPAVRFVSSSLLTEKKHLLPLLKATPWGISPASIQWMKQLQTTTGISLEIPPWNSDYYILTGRQTAARCLEKIKTELKQYIFPNIPIFCTNVEEIDEITQRKESQYIVKTPYSSSGRGLLWITGEKLTRKEREWITGAIKKQGQVSIEPALCKIKDFGWEFFSDGKGMVEYKGISPFETNKKGSFTGNIIYPQHQIEKDIFSIIPAPVYQQILTTTRQVIQETYGQIYEGCIGVDIMIYQDSEGNYLLHPCVEINMRYTMGYLSLQLEKIIHPDSKGVFEITYHKNTIQCHESHLDMQKRYPLKIIDDKITAGYLSLCPVNTQTNYKATLFVR